MSGTSETNPNPIQKIKQLEDKFNKACELIKQLPNFIEYDIMCTSNEQNKQNIANMKECKNVTDYIMDIQKILLVHYGPEITGSYKFHKYCCENSIYPVTSEIEFEMINNHGDKSVLIDTLLEIFKDRIVESVGSNGYRQIHNKIKFFHDSGFNVNPGEFIVMSKNGVLNSNEWKMYSDN